MAQVKRIVAFDCGNTNSGIVVADVTCTFLDIIHMTVVTVANQSEMSPALKQYCEENIIDLIIPNTLVLYENVVTPKKRYKNWRLIRLNKMIKDLFKDKAQVKALLPSQKSAPIQPGTNNRTRKEASVKQAEQIILEEAPEWLNKFQSFPRNHDIADALLMIVYIQKTL